ncbi:MAG TPA: hypothetical protein VF273_10610 [Pelobium sp.]
MLNRQVISDKQLSGTTQLITKTLYAKFIVDLSISSNTIRKLER